MQSENRWLDYVQIVAAACLGLSYYLPFYQSLGTEEVQRVDNVGLFCWTLPVLVIMYLVSNRWAKAALCLLAIACGALDLVLMTFVATFKSTPLIGFQVARAAIVILMVSWLALGIVSLAKPAQKEAEH